MKDSFLDMFDFDRNGKLDLVEKAFLFDAVDKLMSDEEDDDEVLFADDEDDDLFSDDLFDDCDDDFR